MMKALALSSPAKINLTLEVLNKRADGFHNIYTIFARIPFADDFLFIPKLGEESSSVGNINLFTLHNPHSSKSLEVIKDDENLIVRAAKALRSVLLERNIAHTLCDVDICYKKNIPMGAGLGGGSSNAATTLKALASIWKAEIKHDYLLEIAAELGSDVPFFLLSENAAIGEGRGEKLRSLQLNVLEGAKAMLLVCSGIHVSTPSAYRAIGRTTDSVIDSSMEVIEEGISENSGILPLSSLYAYFRNDFEDVVFAKHPSLLAVKEELQKHGAEFALMSGSGSSMFGIFSSVGDAHRACTSMKRTFLNYQLIVLPSEMPSH